MSKMKKLTALLLALVMVLALAACGGTGDDTTNNDTSNPSTGDSTEDTSGPTLVVTEFDSTKTYTINSGVTSIYSSWNPHTFQENTAGTQLDYLRDGLYQFIFNDELHPAEGKEPFTTFVIVPAMAAGDPVDVTAEVKAAHPDWIPEGGESGFAWKVPLRTDLQFDNGHKIDANTFVESIKRVLDPEKLNYRATDVYTGSYGIVGAEAYAKAGTYALSEFVSADFGDDEYVDPANFTLTDAGTYQYEGKDIVLDINSGGNWGDDGIKAYEGQVPQADRLIAAANDKGWVYLTPDLLKDLQDIIAMLHGAADVEAYAATAEDYAYQEFEEMAFFGQTYPEVDYDDTVGFYAASDYEIVFVFKSSVNGFNLYYNALGAPFLVDPEVYDACLTSTETASGTVWTSTYMTSVETSPSYGAYSLTDFQTDKHVHWSKNPTWYGWTDDVNHVYKDPEDGNVYRMNQATDIDWQIVEDDDTRKLMFLHGELDSYYLRPADTVQYRSSDYCYNTPGYTVFFMILNGNMDAIKAREAAADFDQTKYDLESMTLLNFRKAFAVSFDRDDICATIMPYYTAGYGLFGSAQVYDPETCAFYRETDAARQALCDFYSVDVSKYASLEEAADSITGYDPEKAKELFTLAYQDAIDAGYITDADGDGVSDQTVTIYMSRDSDTDTVHKLDEYLDQKIGEVVKGTPWYDEATGTAKISFELSPILDDWVEPLRNGEYDYNLSGWGGSSMDPFSTFEVYVNPTYQYDYKWFDATKTNMTMTVNGEEITMNLKLWNDALNGIPVTVGGKTYCFGSNDMNVDERAEILAKLEGAILSTYDYIPMINDGSLYLSTMKTYYVTEKWHPLLNFGGMTYTKYNYDDEAWAEYCEAQIAEHGQLQY